MRGRLFARPDPRPDPRPALLSVAALMVILLPMLLVASSAVRLAGLPVGLPGSTDGLPPEAPGPVESLEVRALEGGGFAVRARVRRTDVRAAAGEVEERELHAEDLAELRAVLARLKALDPARERITLVPAPGTPAREVVAWMDAVRAGPGGPLFPRVVLAATAPTAGTTP